MTRFGIIWLGILIFSRSATTAITATLDQSSLPRYHVLELTLQSDQSLGTPFMRAVSAVFTAPDGSTRRVGGFYNGNSRWLIRFMPNQTGTWKLKWSFEGQSGEKSFTCTAKSHPKIHGHFFTDPSNPRKLRYEDGTPLFWHGGKYLCIMRPFGTDDLQELSYPERLPTDEYVAYCRSYFENIAALGLNGAVFKVQVLPLLYNLKEMNLTFLKAMDEIVGAAMRQGVNLQINLFDIWGKRKESVDWRVRTPESVDWLLLEPWNEKTHAEATRFYLEYMVNRYAAFPNIMWELWNEAEKLQVSADAASQLYKSIMRDADPYDLPIGASEMYTAPYDLDAAHAHLKYKCRPDQWDFMHWAVHNDKRYAPYYFSYNLPYIWNEIGPWDNDDTHHFTEEDRRSWFRAMFWSALTLGSAGISEDHWTDIRSVPDGISVYHSYFARFVAQIQDVNALEPSDQIKPINANGFLCRNGSKELVAYLYTQQDGSRTDFDIYLTGGALFYQFYNPRTGEWLGSRASIDVPSKGWRRFQTPNYDQDIVFYATSEKEHASESPVEWGAMEAAVEGKNVVLRWRTYAESNNLGFEISRVTVGSSTVLGFVAGAGTSSEAHEYRFIDAPPHGSHTYFIKQIDTDGAFSIKSVAVNFLAAAQTVFPNPARSATAVTIPLSSSTGEVQIYNTLGQLVARDIARGEVFRWDARINGEAAATGLYFYKIISPEKNEPMTGKFYLIR